MKNLFIIKRILHDKELSDEAVVVWCGLRNIMQMNVKQYFVSINMIAHSIFNRVPKRSEREAIQRGYKELVEREYIKEIEQYSMSEHYVDLSALYFDGNEYFSDLRQEEMHKIMNLPVNNDKYKMLRYFACQVGSFNKSKDMNYYGGKVGGMSREYFTGLFPISLSAIDDFNDILMENELLFVIRHDDFYIRKGVEKIKNTYSRWEDREEAKRFGQELHGYKYFTEHAGKRTAAANKKRGLAQKILWFMGGKEYDIETIQDMYVYAEEKNQKMRDEYNREIKNGNKPSKPDYYDLSIFDDYLIQFEGE